jgi:hypothetical protein
MRIIYNIATWFFLTLGVVFSDQIDLKLIPDSIDVEIKTKILSVPLIVATQIENHSEFSYFGISEVIEKPSLYSAKTTETWDKLVITLNFNKKIMEEHDWSVLPIVSKVSIINHGTETFLSNEIFQGKFTIKKVPQNHLLCGSFSCPWVFSDASSKQINPVRIQAWIKYSWEVINRDEKFVTYRIFDCDFGIKDQSIQSELFFKDANKYNFIHALEKRGIGIRNPTSQTNTTPTIQPKASPE